MSASPWVYSIHLIPRGNTECFTTLPIRIHKSDHLAEAATRRFNQEWAATMQDGAHALSSRLSSPVGNYSSYLYPECHPERLGILAYLTELAFLHDDITEGGTYTDAMQEHKALAHALTIEGNETALLECLEIDAEAGMRIIDDYGKVWLVGGEDITTDCVSSVDEYMELRRINAGAHAFWSMVMFSLCIKLTGDDIIIMKPLFSLAERAMIFVNDYYSWPKEKGQNADRIVNVVKFFMLHDHLSENEVRAKTREHIVNFEKQYLSARQALYRKYEDLPIHLVKLAEVIEVTIAGVHYFTANSPRYQIHSNDPNPSASDTLYKNVPSNFSQSTFQQWDKQNHQPVLSQQGLMGIDKSALNAPILYIQSLPSKRARSQLLDAFNIWFEIDHKTLTTFKSVIEDLHSASLILDDIEDQSPLRRGSTATHLVFGAAQSVNSATYLFVQASRAIHELNKPELLTILFDELEALFVGQSWDLQWRDAIAYPSEQDYWEMVDQKTGAMFQMVLRFMVSTTSRWSLHDFKPLITRLGRWFQIRDDYMNLQSEEYTDQKGFCEDLDEMKLSYTIMKLLHSDNTTAKHIVQGIFRRNHDKKLSVQTKIQILSLLHQTGALAQTWECLQALQSEIEALIESFEGLTGEANPTMRLLLKVLNSIPPPKRIA
ncbi:terpenoid synthase [Aspergillus bertholletiae]|uniref:Terpenoid synthase n=1 Tax=Aspergillus bertholletiae TaxID=1226010 RepID=A0A5N7AWI8_9EURO|nr:terpenoid synthase [Aspergillus bertholletiae]